MARIEWVKQRLENWALWLERSAGGGLGFASQSAFLNEARTDRYRTSHVPCDEVDASVTDQGVAALRLEHPHLAETVMLIHAADCGVLGASRALNIAESSVHARLAQADVKLAAWFTERQSKQAELRRLRGFTS